MLLLLALGATALALVVARPTLVDAAAEVKSYENTQLKVYFEYPASWQTGPRQPRGLLPNELLTVQSRDGTAEFNLALYRLATPLTDDNFDQQMQALDRAVAAWVARLPGGKLLESDDTYLDGADGRWHSFEYLAGNVQMYGELTVVVHEDLVAEIGLAAKDEEFGDTQPIFDEIMDSLFLPWSEEEEE